jgi:lipoprotein-anchoring transpeptidase ErfK/SrfK
MRGLIRLVAVGLALYGGVAFGRSSWFEREPKMVVVDKSSQTLRAYEGNQVVMASRVSTGRRGRETPDGRFRVQSKSVMHYSKLYANAPMPYSVQFAGNYFIHGFSSVPSYPASHGCIRVPLNGEAQAFYNWVSVGTPVVVTGRWGR